MRMLSFAALAACALALVVGGGDAQAKRKPKEIVVVGSKVKEVIRSAGLVPGDDLVEAVERVVRRMVREAGRRARSNGRRTVRPHDLGCLPETTSPDLLVHVDVMGDELRSGGFRSDGELVQAVSDTLHEALADAVVRAIANKRSTVRPYDL